MSNIKKLKLYLDTSIISHLDAPDTPEKMADTKKLWDEIRSGKYEVYLSDTTFDELARCHEPKRSFLADRMGEIAFRRFADSDESLDLAEKFIDFGILREKSKDDCRHIAVAILTGCDIIVSWNFKHIVNPKTMRGVKMVTTSEGYKDLMICTPTMLVEGEI